MFAKILNGIINSEIKSETIIEWLTADDPNKFVFADNQTESTRGEFIIYFLDYLKNQCQGFLCNNDDNEVNKKKKTDNNCGTEANENINDVTNGDINKKENKSDVEIGKLDQMKNQFSTPEKKCQIQLTSTPLKSTLSPNNSMDNSFLNSSRLSESEQMSSTSSFHFYLSPGVNNSKSYSFQSPSFSVNTNTFNSPNYPDYQDENFPSLGNSSAKLNNSDVKKGNWKKSRHNDTNGSRGRMNNSNQNKKNNRSVCLGDFFADSVNAKTNHSPRNQFSKSFTSDKQNESFNDVTASPSTPKNDSKKRRIKPTKLITTEKPEVKHVFGVVTRPQVINPQFVEAQSKDKSSEETTFEAERELMKLERKKNPQVTNIAFEASLEPQNVNKTPVVCITPKLELADNLQVLINLADVYSALLTQNLVPNLMTEFYFIISLITCQNSSKKLEDFEKDKNDQNVLLNDLKESLECVEIIDDELLEKKNQDELSKGNCKDQQYFHSIHNCVYFSSLVIMNCKYLISILDRTMLKLLLDNTVLVAFQPELKSYLNEIYEAKCLQTKTFTSSNVDTRLLQKNVCFQMDTDNRTNFPNSKAFSTFRKQRDLFYEILKIWEDNHLKINWSFRRDLEKKICALLLMHDDTINYYHIAQLFKSQLLVSSIQMGQIDDPKNEDDSLICLQFFKNLNPQKLNQLKQRLVTPFSSTGLVPRPTFPGVEEFYRDFIQISSNPKFLTILENIFIQEIMELNDTQFTSGENEIKETAVNENTKQDYLLCISNLRLLAKFLGFVLSLPFQSNSNLDSITTQILLRSRSVPSIDLYECLRDSLENGKLSLTIPWLVQFLSMLDYVSFRLPYYKNLCEILYFIYRNVQNLKNQELIMLITLNIGWLFEQPNFPKEFYFDWQSKYKNKQIILRERSKEINGTIEMDTSKSIIKSVKNEAENMNPILDELNIIDDRAIYNCCPYLKELKILLTSESSVNSNNFYRHITPVSSKLTDKLIISKETSLELQLEKAFLHGQPRSVQKTIDFVSERITSSCVKHINKNIIKQIRNEKYKKWNQIGKKNLLEFMINEVTSEIRNQCKKIIPVMCKEKIKNSMESLLADDITKSVKNMCIRITIKMTIERIDNWIDSYINNLMASNDNFHYFFNKNIHNNANEIDEKHLNNNSIDINKPFPTSVINSIRKSMWELIEKNGQWSTLVIDHVLIILNNLYHCLNEQNGTQITVENILYKMSVDYAVHLIVFQIDLFTIEIEKEFFKIWQLYKLKNNNLNDNNNDVGANDDVHDDTADDNVNENDYDDNKIGNNHRELFSGLLSPRNIKLLMQSKNNYKNINNSWIKYGQLMNKLLKNNFITMDKFSEECVALLRLDWPTNIMKLISICLKVAIDNHQFVDEHSEKMKFLLEWIAGTCSDWEHFDSE